MSPRPRSEINVTPLVDVAMVVLIIFMVMTPLIEHGPDVRLPETRRPQTLPDAAKLTITLRQDGAIFLDGFPLETAALPGALRGRELDRATIVVRADGRLPYGAVRDVLALLGSAGVSGAGLETVAATPDV